MWFLLNWLALFTGRHELIFKVTRQHVFQRNVLYLFIWDKYKDKYIRSVVDFKPCFRVRKSDIKTKKYCRDILIKRAYVPLPLLDISELKSLNNSIQKTFQKLRMSYRKR